MDDGRVRRTGGWMMDVLEERVDVGHVKRMDVRTGRRIRTGRRWMR